MVVIVVVHAGIGAVQDGDCRRRSVPSAPSKAAPERCGIDGWLKEQATCQKPAGELHLVPIIRRDPTQRVKVCGSELRRNAGRGSTGLQQQKLGTTKVLSVGICAFWRSQIFLSQLDGNRIPVPGFLSSTAQPDNWRASISPHYVCSRPNICTISMVSPLVGPR